jgi:YesN/AraC family two-component response regulator
MPGVDGHDLILKIRRLCPHIDTMVFSGFAPDDGRPRTYPILPKPFTKQQLLAAVKQILDAQI